MNRTVTHQGCNANTSTGKTCEFVTQITVIVIIAVPIK